MDNQPRAGAHRSAHGVLKPRHLADLARRLADDHRERAGRDAPLESPAARVRSVGHTLRDAYDRLVETAMDDRDLPPGTSWILDNFYLARDQLRDTLIGLNRAHYRQLPRLRDGPYEGAPRVYELLSELARAVDHSIDETSLTTVIRAYQDVSALALGELWAVPAALRIVLLERLGSLALEEAAAQRERVSAAEWAARIVAPGSEESDATVVESVEGLRSRGAMSDAFALELAERLRDGGDGVYPALDWIEGRLRSRGATLEDLVRQETRRQVSIANAFKSLRWAADARWDAWVERVSVIERVLRLDPAQVYPLMDYATRDRYRQRIEALSRGADLAEVDVAERLLEVSRRAPESGEEPVRHVGYHLIGPGCGAFEEGLDFRPGPSERLRRTLRRHPATALFIATGGFAGAALFLVIALLLTIDPSPAVVLSIAALGVFPALEAGVALSNRLFAYLVPPELLPKLGRERGVSREDRTLVVVPTLVSTPADAREQAERLETLYFANPDPNLRFALLSDYTDASARRMPEDAAILAAAREAVRRLNERHADRWGDRFFLLHRERRWSESEQSWMGWERKRGKLEELNILLRHPERETSFTDFEGDFRGVAAGDAIRFVITLDADTRMPPFSAVDLVRTAAHPLNRPRFDPSRGRVTRGFGVIQPRVSTEASRERRSPFARIMSSGVGLDPYTHAVSDVYQDLFGEGIYTGKGLYDVDAFERGLGGVIPPGAVLSHDLLESTFVRAGLATDLVLFDDFPTHYIPWARRLHRWVRGDWQILPWIGRSIELSDGRRIPNPIGLLGRWQILDNVRRSLSPPALLAFLVAGWVLLPAIAPIWTVMVVGLWTLPLYTHLTTTVLERPPHVTWRSWLDRASTDLTQGVARFLLGLTLLAHQAIVHLDAAGLAVRRLATRRGLLEWATARQVESRVRVTAVHYLRQMWPASALGAGILALVASVAPAATPYAIPFCLLWIGSPIIAWALSRRQAREGRELTSAERLHLRMLGRLAWGYFEDYWNAEQGWLPADNVQVTPWRGAARRTSPSNIGFALLSAVVAYDFGWISLDDYLERVDGTLRAIAGLDKHRGHLYNWYETPTGRRLWPPYVSTADSGNFTGSLIVLASHLEEVAHGEPPAGVVRSGLRDTIRAVEAVAPTSRLRELAARALRECEAPGAADPPTEADLRRLEPLVNRLDGAALPDDDRGAVPREESLAYRVARAPRRLLSARLMEASRARPEASARALELAQECRSLVERTDFGFLYERDRALLAIGYNVETSSRDEGAYDLLASEARLASFLAVASGDVPVEHWLRLGRPVVDVRGRTTLLSWGGTMFEYLMPLLFVPGFRPTLLETSHVGAVERQVEYGRRRGLPWGASESQYAAVNSDGDYRYRAFGVPGLGLKRGLHDDYVVAPYASALALMVDARRALSNLAELETLGALGPYGHYEAVDFTRSRVPAATGYFVVKTVMAHHAGMTLTAFSNVLLDGRIQDLFRRSPVVRAAEMLLHERVPPRIVTEVPHPMETAAPAPEADPVVEAVDHVRHVERDGVAVRGHLLTNGRLRTFYREDGVGTVSHGNTALIRGDAAARRFPLGLFLYVRDVETGRLWSVTREPVRGRPDRLETWFHLNRIQVARVEDWIETFMEVVISPEDDIEIRRLTITNYSDRRRRLDVTSYAEVVLDDPRADRAHPAFSKLFVRTERPEGHEALLATRRSRVPGEDNGWLVHTLACDRARLPDAAAFETNRLTFIGRGRGLDRPAVLDRGRTMSGETGHVLDPVVSLQKPVTIGPGESVQIAFGLGIAPDRASAIGLADLYDNPAAVERAIELARTSGTLERQHLGVAGERLHEFQRLGAAIATNDPALRSVAPGGEPAAGTVSGLWRFGISGDVPIVLARVSELDQVPAAAWLRDAYNFWRRRGLEIDLVFLNEREATYADELQHALERLSEHGVPGIVASDRAGIRVLRTPSMSRDDRRLLASAARAVLDLSQPILPIGPEPAGRPAGPGALSAPEPAPPRADPAPVRPPVDIRGFNGYGGFCPERDEYVIRPVAVEHPRTPAPWINVIANPDFGFFVTEAGSSTTWSINSRQRRLSPWSNDPVRDPTGEALYIRDDDSGAWWSPLVEPAGDPLATETRHGYGYSVFTGERSSLWTEITMHVDAEAPVKGIRVRIRNRGDRPRRLSVYLYVEWVLGVSRRESARHVHTRLDEEKRAILARNPFDRDFGSRVAFAVGDPRAERFEATCDRTAFLGLDHDPRRPAGLQEGSLDGSAGAGLDPCATMRLSVELDAHGEADRWFFIGDAEDGAAAEASVQRVRQPGWGDASLERGRGEWREAVGALTVETPAPELDVLLNGWLLYQTLSCRVWGRTAFYQSGGAFGYRDQLQDTMMLVYTRPHLTRRQILLHAAHQFPEGDVLHWWHPPAGRGVRTRISDDLLWLPFVTSFYVESTGDTGILAEDIAFLEARALEPGEHEAYLEPTVSDVRASLYEHCCLAIDRSLDTGPHGLPLMGAGDWNDGMNRVGEEGRGESVWLGFFLVTVIDSFLRFVEERGDERRHERYTDARGGLVRALEAAGWDGEWYRRAYHDDGTPIGSASNEECRIDAIAQAWSVLSGVAPPERRRAALESAERMLVDREAGLIRLLTPPFSSSRPDPGYIQGYPPGVRENGGQYTHGVLWMIQALAAEGLGDRAGDLFRMILPPNHVAEPEAARRFRNEPYVTSADVYSVPPHAGRAGWSWYTGSGGWMYRVALESILGFRIVGGDRIRLSPCISRDWARYRIAYALPGGRTRYRFEVENPQAVERGIARATVDGNRIPIAGDAVEIELTDDGREHTAVIVLGARVSTGGDDSHVAE